MRLGTLMWWNRVQLTVSLLPLWCIVSHQNMQESTKSHYPSGKKGTAPAWSCFTPVQNVTLQVSAHESITAISRYRLNLVIKGHHTCFSVYLPRRLRHKTVGKCPLWLWQKLCHGDVIEVISACVWRLHIFNQQKGWLQTRAVEFDRHGHTRGRKGLMKDTLELHYGKHRKSVYCISASAASI